MRAGSGWMIPALTALALLAAPLAAQEPVAEAAETEADAGERPLVGMNAQQVAAFFMLVANSPELDAELTPLVEQLLEPGEPVPDWRETGIDMLAELGAREGGLTTTLLRDEDTEVLSVTDLSGEATPDFTGFSQVALRAAPPGGIDEQVFMSFAPGLWLVATSQRKLRGKAMCYSGMMGLTLYSKRPVTEQTMDELLPTIFAISMIDRTGSREFCLVYERVGDAYRARSFLPDGRRLPQLDADPSLLRIMPAADLSAYLRDAVPVRPAE